MELVETLQLAKRHGVAFQAILDAWEAAVKAVPCTDANVEQMEPKDSTHYNYQSHHLLSTYCMSLFYPIR